MPKAAELRLQAAALKTAKEKAAKRKPRNPPRRFAKRDNHGSGPATVRRAATTVLNPKVADEGQTTTPAQPD